MNILSLFDGISAGQLALKKAKVAYEKYYASEINKYAIKVTQKNHPDTIQLGDVNEWRNWQIDWASIGLIMGGFPCQSFSLAGFQNGFNDERGQLFFTMIDIFNHVKLHNQNVKFLFENTRMKPEYMTCISEKIGVEPIYINSSDFSPQQRARFYWTNIDIAKWIPSTEKFQDILESGIAPTEKAYACTASYCKKGGEGTRQRSIRKHQKSVVLEGKETRWLSPVEFERLQTMPDDYTFGISNTQRYIAVGNSWTVNVIAHILKDL